MFSLSTYLHTDVPPLLPLKTEEEDPDLDEEYEPTPEAKPPTPAKPRRVATVGNLMSRNIYFQCD